jgi:hypothetical protein
MDFNINELSGQESSQCHTLDTDTNVAPTEKVK